MIPPFEGFPKIPRWSREIIITEKIDGTNGQVYISPEGEIYAGSRNRWITPSQDNHGFAAWVEENKEDLRQLGPGHHYGEWWGQGIQRGYGLKEKRFSLFNRTKWDPETVPDCCRVVPLLYRGMMLPGVIEEVIEELRKYGSCATPGFKNPEGIVIYHVAGGVMFKKTLENDEQPKGTYATEA